MSAAVPYITPSTAAAARRFAVIASIIVGALAIITILGWILGVDAMTGGPGATPEVKLNAGLALLALAGAALLNAHGGRTGTAALALAAFAGLVGAFTFAQYPTGIDLRIDQLLIDDHLGADSRHPGRMAPLSALALLSLALALLLRGPGGVLRVVQQALAVLPFVFGLLGAVGLLYGFRFLTGMSLHLAGMSPFTAVALMLLSAAILALDVDTGLMRLVLSNRSGGRFVRAMLPVAILFPVVTGWARMYGEMVGYFDNHFGILMMVLSAIFVYSLIAVLSARRLNQAEDKLLEAQQTLARRVQERTHDLEVTVANLRAESELRAAAEQSRAQSQATLRSALEHAPIGMAIVGLNGRFLQVNRSLCDIVGRDEPELLRCTFQDITHPDDLDKDVALVGSLVRGEIPHYQMEKRYVRADGEPIWVLLSVSLVRDTAGDPAFFVSQVEDISLRREAEREVAASRQFLGDIVNSIPIPLTVKDASGRILVANTAMAKFHGGSTGDLVGKTDFDLFPAPRARTFQAEDEALLRTGVPFSQEQAFDAISGERRWVIKHKHRIVLSDGNKCVLTTLLDITERKEAELELARSRGFLDAIIDAIPQPLFVKDDRHRWVLLNSAFCDLLGRDRKALLGNSDPSFYPDDWVARVWAEDDQVLSGNGSVVVEEISEPRPDGSARWMLKSKKRVDLPDGSRVIVGISADISRLKEVEEALRKSEALHRLLADNSSDLISLLTPTGAIEYASPASVAVLGRRPDELVGMPVTEIIHPDDQQRALQVFKEAVKSQAHAVFTCRLKRSDGSWSWIETSFRAIVDNDTGLTRQIIGVSRDVNERVRVTDALNHFKYVLDNTLDMIFIYDADTLRFNYVNEGAVRTLGYPRERLLGMTPWQVRADIEEKDYPRSIKPFLEGRISSRQLESVHRRADGSLIPVEVTMQLIRRPGEVGTFIAIARDLTERKKMEQMKNEFISTVSHELRTPVTSIRGSLGLLAGGVAGKLPKQAKELIDIANNNSERLIRLINDILDIEKIESGKMRFAMGPVQLPGLLNEALREVQGYAARFNVSLRIEGEIPDVTVRADRDRILQVLANLLSNAAKFSPPGAEVLASAKARAASVRVLVTDHGSGIPPEFHDKIFGKFLQADASDSREKGGTGLGLSIAKAIVEKHGGEIGFHTVQGEGTTFYFDLPLMFSATQAPGDGAQTASGSIR